jgi:hypothetical protein
MEDTQYNYSNGSLECNSENFGKPDGVDYVPVSRPGWGDVGINGGGDLDWVDYRAS